MRKILLPLFAVLLFTACQKETVSEQAKPQEETATAIAAKGTDKITIWHYNATNNTWKLTTINANAWPEHQAHGDIWKVGQNYKGGKIGYILQAGDPGYDANVPHGLIAAASDLLVGSNPRADWFIFTLQEFDAQYYLPGSAAQGTAIGTGMANTTAIVQALTNFFAVYGGWNIGQIDDYAAYACDNLQLNGYTDWFLPSIDELKQIMINREIIGGFATPELEAIGYVVDGIRATYWSSSAAGVAEDPGANIRQFAKVCYYTPGTPSNTSITDINFVPNRIRPVRYF